MIHDYYLSKVTKIKEYKSPQSIKKKKEILEALTKEHMKDTDIFYPSPADLAKLPRNSILIKVSFTLKKPYTSKEEREFHTIDNPIVRDKFTGLPMVRPSTWKGQLRFAARRVKWHGEKERIIRRLFGSEPKEKSALKGRLYFFPTFFEDGSEKDVITPLKRDTRTPAKGPISLEIMKPDKKGDFYLFYIPYPRNKGFKDEIKEDLKFVAEALKLMFYTYGFSAKKTSGFGVIKKQLNEGKIWTRTGESQDFSNLDELSERLLKTLDGMRDEQH